MTNEITQTFNSFMSEMHHWEEVGNQYIDNDEDVPENDLLEQLKIIYSKYLTNKDRKKGRLNNFTIMSPPEYTPTLEKITNIEITGNVATVYTERTYAGLDEPRIYKWKNINGSWKIDSAKQYDSYDEKWDTVYL